MLTKKKNAQRGGGDNQIHADFAIATGQTQREAGTTRAKSKAAAKSSRQVTRHKKFLKKAAAHLA